MRRPPPCRSLALAPHGSYLRGDRRAPAPGRSPTPSWGGPAARRPPGRSRRPDEREAGGDGAGRAGPRGRPWRAGRPRRTARKRRRRASAPASRRAGGQRQPSCGGRSSRPAGCRGTPAGCRPSIPLRQAYIAGPLPPALGGRATRRPAANDEGSACRAVRGGRHQVTTAVDGAAAAPLKMGAKNGSVGSLSSRFHVATKPGDKKWHPGWTGLGER